MAEKPPVNYTYGGEEGQDPYEYYTNKYGWNWGSRIPEDTQQYADWYKLYTSPSWGRYKTEAKAGYPGPLDTSALDEFQEEPSFLESLGITPEQIRDYIVGAHRWGPEKKYQAEQLPIRKKRFRQDFTRMGKAALAGVAGGGGLASSGAALKAGRAAGQYARGLEDVEQNLQREIERKHWSRFDRALQAGGMYAGIAGEEADRKFQTILAELDLSMEERNYLTQLVQNYLASQDEFGLDKGLNIGLSLAGIASGLGWAPLAASAATGGE